MEGGVAAAGRGPPLRDPQWWPSTPRGCGLQTSSTAVRSPRLRTEPAGPGSWGCLGVHPSTSRCVSVLGWPPWGHSGGSGPTYSLRSCDGLQLGLCVVTCEQSLNILGPRPQL